MVVTKCPLLLGSKIYKSPAELVSASI